MNITSSNSLREYRHRRLRGRIRGFLYSILHTSRLAMFFSLALGLLFFAMLLLWIAAGMFIASRPAQERLCAYHPCQYEI